MTTWTRRQTFTHAILLLLLVFDFSQSLLLLIYDAVLGPSVKEIYFDQLKFWMTFLYWLPLLGSFPIIVLVINLNQLQLQKLNIDRFYVALLMISGLMGMVSLPFNCLTVIAFFYINSMLLNNKARFAVFDSNIIRMILLILGGYVVILATRKELLIMLRYPVELIASFAQIFVVVIVLTLAVYRGMLYMFLIDLGLTKSKAFYVQALLFWIKHMNHLLGAPVFFWIILPILSLTFGYIAFRTKSLTPSTLTHILYNTLAEFVVFF